MSLFVGKQLIGSLKWNIICFYQNKVPGDLTWANHKYYGKRNANIFHFVKNP